MVSYFSMALDLVFGLFCLWVITRILGKTQMAQITPFDFISAVLLGELVGNALFDEKISILQIAFVIFVFGFIMWSAEKLTQKFKRLRYLIEGYPSIIIHKGKLFRDAMKKNNLDIDQLQHLLRNKDVFSIQEVEFAILEANGDISVLKKSDFQTPTRKDMKLSPQDVPLPTTIISDGEMIYDNLKEKNLTEEWVLQQIQEQGYDKVEDVFYAEYTSGEDLFILPFLKRGHHKYN